MKKILFLATVASLLTTTGCIVPVGERGEGGDRRDRHEHSHYEERPEVIVGPPVVVVRPPEVIVR